MPLEPLKITKRWTTNNDVEEADFDEITDKTVAWSTRTDNNLKQIGLDLNGADYDYNNDGRATQSTSIIGRLVTLEAAAPGIKNLALDISSQNILKLVSADGTDLSSSNPGSVAFNSTSNIGQIVTVSVTANLSLTLTGAHWGLDTVGDFANVPLWVYLIDDAGTARMGVAYQSGREFINTSDVKTAAATATSAGDVFVTAALGQNSNFFLLGWVKADFDDTGNAGGENYWTIQNAVGDVNIGQQVTYVEGTFRF